MLHFFEEGDTVLIKSFTPDPLKSYFGDQGDGDFWVLEDIPFQQQAVGSTAVVAQVECTKYHGDFIVLDIPGQELYLTYHCFDLVNKS